MKLDNGDHAGILRTGLNNPHLLLVLTALAWAGHWIVARGVIPYTTPAGMAFWRWATAIVLLAPFALPSFLRQWPEIRRAWRPLLFFGTCGTVLYNVIGYYGIRNSTATNAVLLQSVTPGVIPLFAWLLFRERLRYGTAIGLALSFAGVLAIVSRLELARLIHLQANPGDLWLLANVALWALYTACLRWAPRGVGAPAFMLSVMLAGMLSGIPAFAIDLAHGGATQLNAGVVLGILYLAAVPSLLCYFMWNAAVAQVGAAKAGVYLNLIPLAGALMAVVFLDEAVHGYHVAGFVFIVSGVYIASRRR
jgi:drug/metabolite transporter (DMT)-like permease